MLLRQPAVAGRFYPDNPAELSRLISDLAATDRESNVCSAIGCLVPHAGYRYSGRIAGKVYSRLKLPSRFLLIGPRHFPAGKPLAILSDGAWRTPLGQAHIDAQLAAELKQVCPSLSEDAIAHRSEHALEVQLPFLQYLCPDFRFVPIALGPVPYPQLKSLGEAIADVLRRQPDPVLVIASSDMNHYESDEITRSKDADAIKFLLALDPHGLFDVVRRESITMCGYGAAIAMLTASRLLGATRATLAAYATSADVNGDRTEAVGYAGVIVDAS